MMVIEQKKIFDSYLQFNKYKNTDRIKFLKYVKKTIRDSSGLNCTY